jgi:hypothetical protein
VEITGFYQSKNVFAFTTNNDISVVYPCSDFVMKLKTIFTAEQNYFVCSKIVRKQSDIQKIEGTL